MSRTKLNFYYNILKFTLVFPFQYDSTNKIFQKSNYLQFTSQILSIILCFILFHAIKFWTFSTKNEWFIGNGDFIFMVASCLDSFILGVVLAYEKFFKLKKLLHLSNKILLTWKYYRINNQEVLENKLIRISVMTLIILPITVNLLNFIYFGALTLDLKYVVVCTLITIIWSWNLLSINPLLCTIIFFNHNMKIMNQKLKGLIPNVTFIENKQKQQRISRQIRELREIYVESVKTFNLITEYYQLHTLFFIFGNFLSSIWQVDLVLDKFIFHRTEFNKFGFINLLPYFLNVLFSTTNNSMYLYEMRLLLTENQKTVNSILDLKLKFKDTEIMKEVVD